MKRVKGGVGVLCWLVCSTVGMAEWMIVAGGSPQKSQAQSLKAKLAEIRDQAARGTKLSLRKVEGVWLVELGPLGLDAQRLEDLVVQMTKAGMDPVIIPEENRLESWKTERWMQWGAVILLALGGGAVLFQGFRRARKLGGAQEHLQERQQSLEAKLAKREQEYV